MELFYSPEISESNNFLTEEESMHCIKVLRKTNGDEIHVTDGKGNLCSAVITSADRHQCGYEVTKVQKEYGHKSWQLHLGICPTKSFKRFEWFIEKAIEVGVDVITPIICKNSERRELKSERLQKVAIGAMKQSLKAYLPVIQPVAEFNDLVTNKPSSDNAQLFIANYKTSNQFLLDQYQHGSNALVLIGPEGDFDQEELDLATAQGFEMVNLSKSRLRTETAGLVACTSIGMVNDAG